MSSCACPICLEDMDIHNAATTVLMPVCQHRIHTVCALRAAQYDLKCPVCRTCDPSFNSNSASRAAQNSQEVLMFQELEELNQQHSIMIRRYQQKRCRTIRKNKKLMKIRDRLKDERQYFDQTTRELEKLWLAAQKNLWKEDVHINDIKKKRRKLQQRTYALEKKLNQHIENEIGPSPSLYLETLFLHE